MTAIHVIKPLSFTQVVKLLSKPDLSVLLIDRSYLTVASFYLVAECVGPVRNGIKGTRRQKAFRNATSSMEIFDMLEMTTFISTKIVSLKYSSVFI